MQSVFSNLQKVNGPCTGKIKDAAGHNVGWRFKNKEGKETEILKAEL